MVSPQAVGVRIRQYLNPWPDYQQLSLYKSVFKIPYFSLIIDVWRVGTVSPIHEPIQAESNGNSKLFLKLCILNLKQ